MPAPGDQHKDTIHSANPFADTTPTISKYTAVEIATLQSRLEKQLGPEYISTRPGAGGGKVHYLAAEKVINLANEVFGFNGWSSSIQNVQIDFVDEHPTTQKINLGLSTIVRVTLKDGSFHEDIGYGHCENVKGKAAAFEKAKKEAATDAMKRALRNFGNVLGNCLYDKDYLSRITKVKVQPSKWDASDLHRHRDYKEVKKEATSSDERQAVRSDEAPRQGNSNGSAVKRNTSVQSVHSAGSYGSAEFEDDFDGDFDDTDFSHPDEVRVDDSIASNAGEGSTRLPKQAAPQQRQELRPVNIQAPTPMQGMQAPQRPQSLQRPPPNAAQRPANSARMGPPQTPGDHAPPPARYQQQVGNGGAPQLNTTEAQRSNSSSDDSSHPPEPRPQAPPPGAPIGFVTGRRADVVNTPTGAGAAIEGLAFNPHAESPSIRRTQGVNPGKSAPITRDVLKAAREGQNQQQPAQQHPPGATRSAGANYTNPSADMNRKIGMPQSPAGGGGFSGGRGSGAYKPPTSHGVKRSALGDVTNMQLNQGMDGASDPKKAKIETGGKADGLVE
ncbi:related to DNA repair and recombination protein rhm52 [Ramularia collo-cygni]|uniref:RAD52 homolog n=1 Tax=Ramularia collo-cygni TaxID=112498 RepID=A0A2D3V6C1_9PEZI|nr:related to DNA repair and recombination protein rhm52 [Ramularia collo-cygni]CZT20980.1 related to DNA repair and recombination protein rhm52 [Ramularia collo-cygni]